MSYQVLARKWRPHNFSQVIGQQHVLTALSNGLAQNRVHHAYLFSGTRGVGKTTIARILAKSLNCELGVTATPCGKCENCTAIDQGRFVDLLEIDAASRTKVDDTRELLDNVQYKPAVGRYKVYLIDEVHMLSKHSFNALLKTLEEPPEYVKFLLATTDPQKLPITVLSRCLQFHLKAILPEKIETQLAYILQHEQATFEHTALNIIAKAADGSMRDALSLTDQALAFGNGNIEYQSVLKMLGTLDKSHLHYLLHFIASGNVAKVFQKIEEFVVLGADFAKVHQELAALCHQIALQQFQVQQANSDKSALQLLSERLTPEEVQLYYQIALQGFKDYSFAPNGKVALEMTVMRLLAFKPANYIELDENCLIDITPENITIEKSAPSIAGSEQIAPEVITEPVLSDSSDDIDEQHIITPTSIAVPIQETQSTAGPVEQAEQGPVNVQQHAPQQDKLQSSSEQVIESIDQVTHSRNMLRSYRLKRNETKKSQATTENINNKPVVAKLESVESIKPDVQSTSDFKKNEVTALDDTIENSPLVIAPQQENEFSEHQHDADVYDPYAPPVEYQSVDSTVAPTKPQLTDAETLNENVSFNAESISHHHFFSDQPFEMVNIDTAKYVEDKLTDPWSLAIQKMQLNGLVKLLAKNSVLKQLNKQLVLTLKPEQQHLLNNSGLCEELQSKLKDFYGAEYEMYIEVGIVEGQLTASESEMALYEQYLNNAKHAILEDEFVNALVVNCGAKIYENSVIPL